MGLLHHEGIVLVVDIEGMLTWKDDIQITKISICAVLFCLRSCVCHFLKGVRRIITIWYRIGVLFTLEADLPT